MKRTLLLLLGAVLAFGGFIPRLSPVSANLLQGTVSPACADSEESAFLTLINNYRVQNGLQPLAFSQTLSVAAENHNIDMITNNMFSHTGSDGSSWVDRTRAAGYPDPASTGENIFAGSADAQSAFDWFKNDPPHNATMLNPSYKAIGISRANGPNSQWKWYWTTDFGPTVDAAACTGDAAALVVGGTAQPTPTTGAPVAAAQPTVASTVAPPPAEAPTVVPPPTTVPATAIPPTVMPPTEVPPPVVPPTAVPTVAPAAPLATDTPVQPAAVAQPAAAAPVAAVVAASCPQGEELAFVQALNAYRAQNGQPPLTISSTLSAAAEAQATDMAANSLTSDVGSDGTTIGTRVTNAGYPNPAGIGDLLSFGSEAGQGTLDSLKGTPSLNSILISPSFVAIGVARADNPASPMKHYWMILVGNTADPAVCPLPAPAPAAPAPASNPAPVATTETGGTTTNTDATTNTAGGADTTGAAPTATTANAPVDSDGDGLTDSDELARGTNPNVFDTDQGGVGDGAEVANGTNPLDPSDDGGGAQGGATQGGTGQDVDSDGDGLSDAVEAQIGTNPNVADSDGDGVSDGDEVANGTDPLDPNSF